MNALSRALSAEVLKLRGTLALWMCLVAPATVAVLYVLQMTFMDWGKRPPLGGADAWAMYAQAVLALWSILMLPLFVTLEAALLAGLEHGNQQWKHLLSLPLPRSAHYLAKSIALASLVALSMLVLCLLVPLGGWALTVLQPALGIAGPPPMAFVCGLAAKAFCASLLMVALQAWISLRWRSFTVAVASGMTATVMGYLVGQSERFGYLYPWAMPLQVMASEPIHLGFVMVAGTTGGLLVTAIAALEFSRREVT
jgi:hypothetical protein